MSHRRDLGGDDDALERWAAGRAPELLARAEAEAVAVLRETLVAASLDHARPSSQSRAFDRASAGTASSRTASSRPAPPPGDPPRSSRSDPAPADAPVPSHLEPTPTGTRQLVWAYCVLRSADAAPVGMNGVAADPVECVEAAELALLYSRVPAAEFATEPLTRNLNDLTWLERVARAHEAVLDTALAQSTIVPLRMCTIYETVEGAGAMLEEQRESLTHAVDALEGRLEWSVKVLIDPDRLMSAAGRAEDEAGDVAAAGEGGAYLQRRRAERGARAAAGRVAADTAQQVHARLQDWAIDARTRPPQNRELSGHEGEMVLNAAYLVERERTDELRQLVSELEEHHRDLGARIELTGPWPPYNFVPGADAAALA